MRHRFPLTDAFSRRLERGADRGAVERGEGRRWMRVFNHGQEAFSEILSRVAEAERSIEVRAFLWRDDESGNRLGQALLDAAERGVKVTIHKDRIAAVYEYLGGNKQSFFHKRVARVQGFQAWILGAVYYRSPGSFKQRPNPLVEAIVEHPNIEVHHERKRFDHSKVFVFDDRVLTLGSMGIGDNHRSEWVDVMVEIEGAEHVDRLRRRIHGDARFDPARDVDFLVHSRHAAPRRHCSMLAERLSLIEAASESLLVEMAYLGDRRFTAALLRAVKRGVSVTLVTAAQADMLGNLNRAVCDTLMRRTGAPQNLTIFFLPRMVHSKIVVVDRKICDVGSANFTPLSHGVYDEINLYAVNPRLASDLEALVGGHCEEGEEVRGRVGYRRFHLQVERAVVAYQARHGGRLRRALASTMGEGRAEQRAAKRAARAAARLERKSARLAKKRARQARRSGFLLGDGGPGPDAAGPDAAGPVAEKVTARLARKQARMARKRARRAEKRARLTGEGKRAARASARPGKPDSVAERPVERKGPLLFRRGRKATKRARSGP